MDQETLQSQPVTMTIASKIVNEYRDREMRKSNIIIYDLPEPRSMDSVECKKDDIAVNNAIAKEMDLRHWSLLDWGLGLW